MPQKIRRYDPKATFELRVFEETYRKTADSDWPVRIYQPQGEGPFPALLDVHGGACIGLRRGGDLAHLSLRRLSARGH